MLTTCYRDIYSTDQNDDVGQLQLLTSPLSATEEVLNLYNGGLVPLEIAMPTVLHAIGATKDDIEAAVKNALALQKTKDECERCEQEYTKADREMSLREREVNIKNLEAQKVSRGEEETHNSSSHEANAEQ